MKGQFFTILGKLTFAIACIIAFLALGAFFGHGIGKAYDRQEQGERQYIQNYQAELKREQNKETN